MLSKFESIGYDLETRNITMSVPERAHDDGGWIDDDFHISDTYPALDEAFAELWNDPKMTEYDRYEEFRKPNDTPRD